MRTPRNLPGFFFPIALLFAGVPATAQVYESVGEDGTPVYSDVPTEGAERIELQDTNVADSVDVPPAPPPEPAAPRQPKPTQTASEDPPEELAPGLLVRDNDDPQREIGNHPIRPRPVPRPARPVRR